MGAGERYGLGRREPGERAGPTPPNNGRCGGLLAGRDVAQYSRLQATPRSPGLIRMQAASHLLERIDTFSTYSTCGLRRLGFDAAPNARPCARGLPARGATVRDLSPQLRQAGQRFKQRLLVTAGFARARDKTLRTTPPFVAKVGTPMFSTKPLLAGVVACALLAGCSGFSQPFSSAPTLLQSNVHKAAQAAVPVGGQTRTNSAYSVLYNFLGGTDGQYPYAGLVNVEGTLYGTTPSGGTNNAGTVFTITPAGKETVLYRFHGPPDGQEPLADLIDVNGTLYGTTYLGGANNFGTVYSITKSGAESVLHSFGTGADGQGPYARLVNVNGTLYGTTLAGGANNLGTVYSITTSGTETVLHRFGSGSDGVQPFSGLIGLKGTLYGTTSGGGANCLSSGGCGTVFSITPSGTETVLHSFSGSDGQYPNGRLIDVKGTLYGTTSLGGISGDGTVFKITTSGMETVLYRFSGSDGAGPYGSLIDVKGTLYGTTAGGGANDVGTVFAISLSGKKETVLHSFGAGSDGTSPVAGLIDVKGTLYGTTYLGGTSNAGTVFTIAPL